MPAPLAPELKQKARELVFSDGLTPGDAARALSINRSTVKNWVKEPILHDAKSLVVSMVKSVVNQEARRISNVTRNKLQKALSDQADAIAGEENITVSKLRNTPDRQGLAAVTKTVVETGCMLFGWDKEGAGAGFEDIGSILEAEVVPPAQLQDGAKGVD